MFRLLKNIIVVFCLIFAPLSLQAGVAPNGSFTQKIQIELPLGTNNLQPNLSLDYNSASRNGLLGVGWKLNGIPTITRLGKNIGQGQDDFIGPDGILIDISGDRSIFHSKKESWNRYAPQGACGGANEPCTWVRTDRQGTKYFYGSTTDSQVLASNGTAIKTWLLSKVEDVHGNYYIVEYTKDQPNNFHYPARITYTLGNGRDASLARSVEFTYEGRSDAQMQYKNGGPEAMVQRLKQVDILSSGNLVRAYSLSYQNSPDTGLSRLQQIQELGRDAESILQTHSITWNNLNLSSNQPDAAPLNNQWGISSQLLKDAKYKSLTGDFNGDGRTDLLFQGKTSTSQTYLLLSNPNGDYDAPKNITTASGMNSGAWAADGRTVYITDWNNDGKDDIFLQGTTLNHATYYLESIDSGNFKGVVNVHAHYGIHKDTWSQKNSILYFQDYNGDGKKDLLLMGFTLQSPSYFLESNSAGGFLPLKNVSAAWNLHALTSHIVDRDVIANYQPIIVDINSDGKQDILFQPPNPTVPALLVQSSQQGYQPAVNITNAYGLDNYAWAGYSFMSLDINKDGLSDLILRPGKEVNTITIPSEMTVEPFTGGFNDLGRYYGQKQRAAELKIEIEYLTEAKSIQTARAAQTVARHSNNAYILINNGAGFQDKQTITNLWGMSSSQWKHKDYQMTPYDLEGTGQTGLLILAKTATMPSYYLKGSSNGWFSTVIPLSNKLSIPDSRWSTAQSLPLFADLNGDSYSDLILRDKTGTNDLYLPSIAGERDAVSAIKTGKGQVTNITYQLSTAHPTAVQPNTTGVGIPNTSRKYLVTSTTEHNGGLQAETFDYQYHNQRYILGNIKSFISLGFEVFEKTNRTTGLKQVITFNQSPLLAGRPKLVQAFDHQNKLLYSQTQQYKDNSVYPNVQNVNDLVQELTLYEQGQVALVKKTDFQFDAFGSLVVKDNCSNNQCQTTTIEYAHDISNWILGRGTMQVISSQNNTIQASRRTYSGNLVASVDELFCDDSENCSMGSGRWLSRTIQHDASGNIIADTDFLGNAQTVQYDDTLSVYPELVTNSKGHEKRRSYDVYGNLVQFTDENSNVTTIDYDIFSRPTFATLPTGGKIRFSYAPLGDASNRYVKTEILSSAPGEPERFHQTIKYMDAKDQVYHQETSGDNGLTINETIKITKSLGQVLEQKSLPYYSDAPIQWNEQTKDMLGRPSSVTKPSGETQQLIYGIGSVEQISSSGQRTIRELNPFGKITKIIDAGGGVTRYTYNSSQFVIKVKLPDNQQVLFQYNNFGKQTVLKDPTVGTVLNQFDDMGNLIGTTNNAGETTQFEYDSLNRLVTRLSSDNIQTTMEYDDTSLSNNIGNLSRIRHNGVTTEYSYDAVGNKISEAKQIASLNGVLVTDWAYDFMKREISKTMPVYGPELRTKQEYIYSPAGNLSQVKVNGRVFAEYSDFTAKGAIGRRALDPGQASEVNSFYQYNNQEVIQALRVVDAEGAEIQNLNYQFDSEGNISNIQDQLTGGLETQSYEYDQQNRLVGAQGSYGRKTYAYDSIGNITQMGGIDELELNYQGHQLISGTVMNPPPVDDSTSSDSSGNRYANGHENNRHAQQDLELKYDSLGNVISKFQKGIQWDYIYNTLNQLTAVYQDGQLRQAMQYDHAGMRVHRLEHKNSGHALSTFYPADGIEIRANQNYKRIRVTKVIFAGKNGRLVTFADKFHEDEVNESAQYFVYAGMFNNNTPKGFILGAYYRTLGNLYRPEVSKYMPVVFLTLFIVFLLSLGVWPNKEEKKKKIKFQSRFGSLQRYSALAMVLMLFWTSGCKNQEHGSKDKKGHYENAYAYDSDDGPLSKTFYHTNQIQTTTMVTDKDGKLASKLLYLPYGELDEENSTGKGQATNQFASFTGQTNDASIGLIYYKSRYYDPSLGRFMSADTIIPGKGYDPKGFNRYAYVTGNPVMYNDPTGHCNILVNAAQCVSEATSYMDDLKNHAIDNFEARRKDLTELYQAHIGQLTSLYHKGSQYLNELHHKKLQTIDGIKDTTFYHNLIGIIAVIIVAVIMYFVGVFMIWLMPFLGAYSLGTALSIVLFLPTAFSVFSIASGYQRGRSRGMTKEEARHYADSESWRYRSAKESSNNFSYVAYASMVINLITF